MSDEQPHDVRTATETPDVPAPESAEAPPAHRKIAALLAVAAVAYLLDVISKIIVVRSLAGRDPIRVIDGVLELNLIRNPGAAFSIGVGMTIVFSAVAVLVIVIILRVSRKLYSVPWAIALGLLLGGALGNLTDRIFRAPGVGRGYVVDFIQLPHWPVFNLADSAIVVGGCLMVLLSLRGLHPDGSHAE